jgi:hypothetical protein
MWRELVVVVSGESEERQVENSLTTLGSVTTVRERHYHLTNVGGGYELEIAFDALAEEYSDAEREFMATHCPDPRTILVLYMEVAPLTALFAVLPADAWVDTETPGDLRLVRPPEALDIVNRRTY